MKNYLARQVLMIRKNEKNLNYYSVINVGTYCVNFQLHFFFNSFPSIALVGFKIFQKLRKFLKLINGSLNK